MQDKCCFFMTIQGSTAMEPTTFNDNVKEIISSKYNINQNMQNKCCFFTTIQGSTAMEPATFNDTMEHKCNNKGPSKLKNTKPIRLVKTWTHKLVCSTGGYLLCKYELPELSTTNLLQMFYFQDNTPLMDSSA